MRNVLNVLDWEEEILEKKICMVPNCAREISAKGLCSKHYNYVYRLYDTSLPIEVLVKYIQDTHIDFKRCKCLIKGCFKITGTGYLCHHHKSYLSKKYKNIDDLSLSQLTEIINEYNQSKLRFCSVDGCNELFFSLGFCVNHYNFVRHHVENYNAKTKNELIDFIKKRYRKRK